MLNSDLVHHEIAAGNILIGQSIFLSLALPITWTIGMGAGGPEVTASHERNGRRWVATGDAWYVLYNTDRRWAVELRLTARPAGRISREPARPALTVAGHEAELTWQRRRRGLLKRWPVTYLVVQFCCPQTERQLRVELSGNLPDEAFQELVEALPFMRCHHSHP